jgi:hypothetical protein
MAKSIEELKQAFDVDGYIVKQSVQYMGSNGLLALHKTARNSQTGEPKKAVYVEGDGYSMGRLIGQLLEPEITTMATKWVETVIPALVAMPYLNWLFPVLKHILEDWNYAIYDLDHGLYPNDIPLDLQHEMKGIADGCKDSNSKTLVTYKNILALNAGIDTLFAAVWTGLGIGDKLERSLEKVPPTEQAALRSAIAELKPKMFRAPRFACNALAAFGSATVGGKFYFGRDFQFPAKGGFEDCACMIIYNPSYDVAPGVKAVPMVAQTAPGMVGSVTAMNNEKVALGVNVVISANCNPARPGLNSLLMVRHAAQCGYGLDRVIQTMVNARRGVSWIYPVGDGKTNRAAVIEAGMSADPLDYLHYAWQELFRRNLLPTGASDVIDKGLFARTGDWAYPAGYLDRNPALFQFMKYPYSPDQFAPDGRINQDWKDRKGNVRDGYFFFPQRESKPDLLVATNVYVTPEMRYCAMNPWPNKLAQSRMADFIWRYDELNRQCLAAYGSIDEGRAIELIDFLAPTRKFPEYYGNEPVIGGSISLCNLTDRTITSRFGHQADQWVKITLPKYV